MKTQENESSCAWRARSPERDIDDVTAPFARLWPRCRRCLWSRGNIARGGRGVERAELARPRPALAQHGQDRLRPRLGILELHGDVHVARGVEVRSDGGAEQGKPADVPRREEGRQPRRLQNDLFGHARPDRGMGRPRQMAVAASRRRPRSRRSTGPPSGATFRGRSTSVRYSGRHRLARGATGGRGPENRSPAGAGCRHRAIRVSPRVGRALRGTTRTETRTWGRAPSDAIGARWGCGRRRFRGDLERAVTDWNTVAPPRCRRRRFRGTWSDDRPRCRDADPTPGLARRRSRPPRRRAPTG